MVGTQHSEDLSILSPNCIFSGSKDGSITLLDLSTSNRGNNKEM